MKKSSKKIINFPTQYREKNEIYKFTVQACKAYIFSMIIQFLITFFLNNPLLSLQILFGQTTITESYIIPYWYSQDGYIANFSTTDDTLIPDAQISAMNYDKACTLRSFFTCSKVSDSQLTNCKLQIHDLCKYEFSYMLYDAYADKHRIFIYGINCGDGLLISADLEFSAKVLTKGLGEMTHFAWKDLDVAAEQNIDYLSVSINDLGGGDGILIYSFELSDCALSELRNGNTIAIYVKDKSNLNNDEQLVEMFEMKNGKIIPSGAGGGDGSSNRYYVYVDVENDNNKEIPIYAAFPIQENTAVDITIIPSESCIMEYSMIYTIDGKDMETEIFTSAFQVPLYESFLARDIMSYMHSNNIQHYLYGITNPSLEQKNKYNPLSIVE